MFLFKLQAMSILAFYFNSKNFRGSSLSFGGLWRYQYHNSCQRRTALLSALREMIVELLENIKKQRLSENTIDLAAWQEMYVACIAGALRIYWL